MKLTLPPSVERFMELLRLWRTLRHGPRPTLLHMFSGSDEWNIGAQGNRVVINISAGAGTVDVTLISLTLEDAESIAERLGREIEVVRARLAPVKKSAGRRKVG